MVALTIPGQGWLNKKDESYIKDDRAIISYHIICEIYSVPITLCKTMGALHSS